MENLLTLNPENATEEEIAAFDLGYAARAVVFDADGNIALLHVSKKNFYKLPGGGFEGDEDAVAALIRECQEEIGCTVTNAREIGTITEYRKMYNRTYISYCFIAEVIGEKCEPNLTDHEKEGGFVTTWVPIDTAIQLVSTSVTDYKQASLYIIARDTCILKEAKAVLGH